MGRFAFIGIVWLIGVWAVPSFAQAEPNPLSRQALALALESISEERRADEFNPWFADLIHVALLQHRAGDAAGARRTAATLLDAAERARDPVERDERLRHVAVVLAHLGEAEQARELALRIVEVSERTSALAAAAGAHAAAGRIEAARETLAALPEEAERAEALALAIQDAVAGGRFEQARALASEQAGGPAPVELLIALRAARQLQVSEAQAAIALLGDPFQRTSALHALGAALNEAGRHDEALGPLREALALVVSLDSSWTSIQAELIGKELANAGAFESALGPASVAGDRRDDVLVHIAREQAFAGAYRASEDTLRLLSEENAHLARFGRAWIIAARAARGDAPASALAAIDDPALRRDLALSAADDAHARGAQERVNALLSQALSAVSSMRSAEERAEAAAEIARAMGELGYIEGFGLALAEARSPSAGADVLSEWGKALAARGERDGALSRFREALAAAEQDAEQTSFLVEDMANAGFAAEALNAARGLPRAILEHELNSGRAMGAIALAFQRAGQGEQALEVVGQISHPMIRARIRAVSDLIESAGIHKAGEAVDSPLVATRGRGRWRIRRICADG